MTKRVLDSSNPEGVDDNYPPAASADPPEGGVGGILSLILFSPRTPPSLRAHVLGYAYRSANSLARTCSALRALVKTREFWRYGVQRELRAKIRREDIWPEDVVREMCQRFDPFFDDWPIGMPCRPAFVYGRTLRWIFDPDDVGDFMLVANHKDVLYRVSIIVAHTVYDCQEILTYKFDRWEQKMEIQHKWKMLNQEEEWVTSKGSTRHSCYVPQNGRKTFYSYFMDVNAGYRGRLYWKMQYHRKRKCFYEGPCDPSGKPLENAGGRFLKK